MVKKVFLYTFFFMACQSVMAQIQTLADFENSIKSLSNEEILNKYDERLIDLQKEKVPDSIIFATLEAKLSSPAINISNQTIGLTVLDMLEYPEFFEKKRLYSFLSWAGSFQARQGKQDEGIALLLEAKSLAEELGNDTLRTKINKEIGIQFSKWDNYDLAKKYLFESLEIAEKLNYDRGIAGVCMTIGNVFKNTDIYDSAQYYYDKSIKYSKLCNFTRGVAGNYNNLGNLFLKQKKYNQAIDYYLSAIPINDTGENVGYLATNYGNLGGAYFDLGDNNQALYYLNKAIKINSEYGDSMKLAGDFEKRCQVYASQNRYKKAYNDLKLSKTIKNRFANRSKLALAADIEANFNNEKKEAKIKQQRAEQAALEVRIAAQSEALALEAEIQKENDLILWGFGIVLLGLLGLVFAFLRSNRQRKQYTAELYSKNEEIETVNTSLNSAKEVLTVKNEEIMDSISYAKRIQAAILPSEKYLHKALKDAFVLYLPKDIVAGDFYWTEQVGDVILFAVADCTGHGVPGAMVSVICNNALNDTIKLKAITDPGEILDNTTDLVLGQFEKSEEEVKDGMDIGLCAFNRTTRKLQYAGANIPLWIVRNEEVIEIKATRQPVGKHALRQKFTTNNVDLLDGDMIYMSSDGYADQFGGVKNKKFMKKNFKSLLAEVSKKPLEEQNNLMLETFSDWKSTNEQVDDICVMGVKFKAS